MAYGGLQEFLRDQESGFMAILSQTWIFPRYTIVVYVPHLITSANWVLGEQGSCLPEEMSDYVYSQFLMALVMPDTQDTSCYHVRVSAAGNRIGCVVPINVKAPGHYANNRLIPHLALAHYVDNVILPHQTATHHVHNKHLSHKTPTDNRHLPHAVSIHYADNRHFKVSRHALQTIIKEEGLLEAYFVMLNFV